MIKGAISRYLTCTQTNTTLSSAKTVAAKTVSCDRQWKAAAFKLRRACFTGAQNGGADFRLVAEAPEFAVRKVTLRRD